jgi:colicin import membrane protein
MWKVIRENPRAVTYAVLMHLALLALLVIGLDWTPKITPSGHKVPIDAELVTPDALPPAQPPKPAVDEAKQQAERQAQEKAEAEAQRRAELEAQHKAEEQAQVKAAAEARRKAQAQRKAELAARKKAEVLAKRKAEAEAKRKAEAEAQRKAEQAARKKAEEQAQAKAAAEAKARAEAEAKKKAAAQAAARRKAEAELQAQLAAEQEEARAQSALEEYIPYIQQKVNDNWIRPPGSPQGLVCVVHVQLIPGGTVAGATVIQSSGDPAFDRSVESAVLKASPLPLPQDPSLFDHFREINFKFNPGR